VVVLDDDPTGTQTVSGVPVLTKWTVDQLVKEFSAAEPAIYLLTNSRSLPAAEAADLAARIGAQIAEAERISGISALIISRSDSTLRGHFPAETIPLERALGDRFDGTVLCPYFADGGRITVGDVHYVVEAGTRVPVGETEFAKDRTFGYRSSNLREWVAEKYDGKAIPMVSLSVEDARCGRSLAKLKNAARGSVIVVNAETNQDLNAQVEAVQAAEAAGLSYLFRTAADWVSAYANIPRNAPMSAGEYVDAGQNGGLIVVGSYVNKTSQQLEQLLRRTATAVELYFESIRDSLALSGIADHVSDQIMRGHSVVLYTSRDTSMAGDLTVGSAFSAALVKIVRLLEERPAYLVAKGGITSSDIATEALGVTRAMVVGRALPGVPVWQCGAESKWPGLTLIVFPGNVGSPTALADLFDAMEAARYAFAQSPKWAE
jgi:uncharacterized protein YgbK (DUF1537 family)